MAFKSSAGLRLRPAIIALALLALSPLLFAAPPAWWAQRGATNSQPSVDKAVANIGQLKHFAAKGRDELNARLVGGAGPAIDALIAGFVTNAPSASDLNAARLGQLKTVAKPFYDRLAAAGFNTSYPWLGREATADNNIVANIGQIKALFSFDLSPLDPTRDINSNDIPDWWENLYVGQLIVDPNLDSDGDGIPDSQEFGYGGNPNAVDTDHDGLSDAEERALGTNPNSDDSDNDGVKDKGDDYPTDKRRSTDIPLLRYAEIDVSTPIIKNDEAWAVAVNDLSQVAFVRNNAQTSKYDSFVLNFGTWAPPPVPKSLPFVHKISSKITHFDASLNKSVDVLLIEEYYYTPYAINGNGALTGMCGLTAKAYRKREESDPAPSEPPPAPPVPEEPAYTVSYGHEVFSGLLKWTGGAAPIFSSTSLFTYTNIKGGQFGHGISNGGICWGNGHGSSSTGTFIGETYFGSATTTSFDFNSWKSTNSQISENAQYAIGDSLGYKVYWNSTAGFQRIFADDTETTQPPIEKTLAKAINNAGEIFGFSESFLPSSYYPHMEPGAKHAFWHSLGTKVDFYSLLPEKFRQQVAFMDAGTTMNAPALTNSKGDLLFTAWVAHNEGLTQNWRIAQLLWEPARPGREAQLNEVQIPYGFEMKQMNSSLVITGLMGKPQIDSDNNLIADVPPTNRAVLLLPVGMDVDTNRDGDVTAEDAMGRDKWSKTRGAIYTVNYDADGGRSSDGYPLPDSVCFNETDGTVMDEDFVIDNPDDEQDIAPLVIKELKALPSGYRVLLKVEEKEDFHAIHVFKKIKAQQTAIWGGLTAPENWEDGIDITIWTNPNVAGYMETRDPPTGDYRFGIEGLLLRGMKMPGDIGTLDQLAGRAEFVGRFSGEVVFKLQIIAPDDSVAAEDRVRLRVAPWLMLDNSRPAETFHVVNTTQPIATNEFAVPFGQAVPHTDIAIAEAGNRWLQDHAEIGYMQRPGGPKTWCAFRLPYSDVGDWAGTPGVPSGAAVMPKWILKTLLKKDSGAFTLGISNMGRSANTGGNLELLPPNQTHPLGRIVQGSGTGFAPGNRISANLRLFLEAQEMQPRTSEVSINWLDHGHIDEVFGFLGSNQVAVASPALAYQLIANTSKIAVSERARAVFFAKGVKQPVLATVHAVNADPTNNTYGTLILNATIPAYQFNWNYLRVYGGPGAGQVIQISHPVLGPDGRYRVQVLEIFKTGSTILPVAGSAEPCLQSCMESGCPYGTLPGVGAQVVLVEDSLWRRNKTPMIFTVQELLSDQNFHTLNVGNIQPLIDIARNTLRSENREAISFVEVPVFFVGKMAGGVASACEALTGNLANLQVGNGQYLFPKPYAPLIGTALDIFENDVSQKLPSSFFPTWDSYHPGAGEVHCGTNVRRSIPDRWWTGIPTHP